MDWVSRFYNVNYVTLLLQNITAGQSYILRSHFRKYILLGIIPSPAYKLSNGGYPCHLLLFFLQEWGQNCRG
jgi:hypothetical protein